MLSVIPMVNDYKLDEKQASFDNFKLDYEPKFKEAIIQFENELKQKLNVNENSKCYLFKFIKDSKLKRQQYKIEVTTSNTTIYAKTKEGFYYATRTLIQLLSLKTAGKIDNLTLNCLTINDSPRFLFRSFMVDEVRHFFGKDEIKRIIDLMADLKFNYYHWHLSDDQGFRINFKEFDNLNQWLVLEKELKLIL